MDSRPGLLSAGVTFFRGNDDEKEPLRVFPIDDPFLARS
jgi:hypothetical protein